MSLEVLADASAALTRISQPDTSSPSCASSWHTLIRLLSHASSSVRGLALLYTSAGVVDVALTLPELDDRERLVRAVLDMAVGDEDLVHNRPAACLLLGRLYEALRQASPDTCPPWLANRGFEVVWHLVLEVWCSGDAVGQPVELTNDEPSPSSSSSSSSSSSHPPPSSTSIVLLAALGYFLESPRALVPDTYARVSLLLLDVLREPRVNSFAQAEVIRALALRLEHTEGNRKRVAQFMPAIRMLTGGTNSKIEMHAHLREACSLFLSIWYPRPPDALLADFPAPAMLTGYARRRFDFLQAHPEQASACTQSLDALADQIEKHGHAPAELGHLGELWCSPQKLIQERKVIHRNVQFHLATLDEFTDPDADPDGDPLARLKRPSPFLPEQGDLTFYMPDGEVRFDAKHCSRTLHLSNRSSDDTHGFVLQISPPDYFVVDPCFGWVEPQSSTSVKITFSPQLRDPPSSVDGFVRLRSVTGFPLERISLTGVTGPVLKVMTSELNFGVCAPGSERSMRIYVRNIGSIPCSCSTQMIYDDAADVQQDGRESIQIVPPHLFIRPNQIREFEVIFSASRSGAVVRRTISLLGMGVERHDVPLQARVGEPLGVDLTSLDFGVIAEGDTVSKSLLLTNHDTGNSLFVSFATRAEHVVVENVTLPPGASVPVPVFFHADKACRGQWSQMLHIVAPHMRPVDCMLHAFVGELLSVRCLPHIDLPPTLSPDTTSSCTIAISNTSKYAAEFLITGLQGTPFHFHVCPAAIGRDEHTWHERAHTTITEDAIGGTADQTFVGSRIIRNHTRSYKLAPHSSTLVHFWFFSPVRGFFQADWFVRLVFPFTESYGPFTLKSSSIRSPKDDLQPLRVFSSVPFVDVRPVEPTDPRTRHRTARLQAAAKGIMARLPDEDHFSPEAIQAVVPELNLPVPFHATLTAGASDALKLSPSTAWIVGRAGSVTMTLANRSDAKATVRIVVPAPFVTSAPLHTVVGAFRTTTFTVSYDAEMDAESGRPADQAHSRDSLFRYGFVAVVDHQGNNIVSADLRGCAADFVEVETVPSALQLLPVRADATASVALTVANHSARTVPWGFSIDGVVISKAQEVTQVGPFSASHPNELHPFERRTVRIDFSSSIEGQFSKDLTVFYSHPDDPARQRDIFSAPLVGVCGVPKLDVPAFVVLGDCPINESVEIKVPVSNKTFQDLQVTALTSPPFSASPPEDHRAAEPVEDSAVSVYSGSAAPAASANESVSRKVAARIRDRTVSAWLPHSRTSEFTVRFAPVRSGVYSSSLFIAYHQRFFSTDILAEGGTLTMTSSMGDPVNLDESSVLDLGMIPARGSVRRRLLLRNSGSLTVCIGSIAVESTSYDHLTALEGHPAPEVEPDAQSDSPQRRRSSRRRSRRRSSRRRSKRVSRRKSKSMTLAKPAKAHSGLAWKVSATQSVTGAAAPSTSPTFNDDSAAHVDWDEVDFAREVAALESDVRRQSILGQQQERAQHGKSHFPVTVIPRGTLALDLFYTHDTPGERESTLVVRCVSHQRQSVPLAVFAFRVRCVVQNLLEPSLDHIDFGVLASDATATHSLKFINTGTTPMPWCLALRECSLQRTQDSPDSVDDSDVQLSGVDLIHDSDTRASFDPSLCCFEISPACGTLAAGQTQIVQVKFDPPFPHRAVRWQLALVSGTDSPDGGGIGEHEIELEGSCGVAELSLSSPAVDFGCMQLGISRLETVMLENRGELPARFRVSNHAREFVVAPQSGFVKPRSFVPLSVRFEPTLNKPYDTQCKIDWALATDRVGALHDRIRGAGGTAGRAVAQFCHSSTLDLSGSGGFPDIRVETPVLAFGMIMLNVDSVLALTVRNDGEASGVLQVECMHVDLRCEEAESDSTIFIPPHSTLDLHLVFHPRELQLFDTMCLVRTGASNKSASSSGITSGSSSRSDTQVYQVHVTGYVGIPRVVLDPPLIFDELDFGPVIVNSSTPLGFTVANTGEVRAEFEILCLVPKPQYLPPGALADEDGKLEPLPPIDELRQLSLDKLVDKYFMRARLRTPAIRGDGDDAAEDERDFPVWLPYLDCSPRFGELMPNQSERVTVSFSPTSAHIEAQPDRNLHLSALLVLNSNHFKPQMGWMRGMAGERRMVVDAVSRVLDFGLCRLGTFFRQSVTVRNAGHVPFAFEVGPDLSLPEFRGVIGRKKQLALWHKQWRSYGLSVHYESKCIAFGSNVVEFTFNPRRKLNFRTRFRIVCGVLHETFEIMGRGARSQLYLVDENMVPFSVDPEPTATEAASPAPQEEPAPEVQQAQEPQAPEKPAAASKLDFGLRAVHHTTTRRVHLMNGGSLPTQFVVSRRIPPSFQVRPYFGTVPPHSSVPLYVAFSPTEPLQSSFTLEVISPDKAFVRQQLEHESYMGGEATDDAASDNEDSDGEATKQQLGRVLTRVPVVGHGGQGILGLTFLNNVDRRINGLEFDVVSVGSVVERYFAVYNTGSVPIRVRLESDTNSVVVAAHGRPVAMHLNEQDDIVGVLEEMAFLARLANREGTRTFAQVEPRQSRRRRRTNGPQSVNAPVDESELIESNMLVLSKVEEGSQGVSIAIDSQADENLTPPGDRRRLLSRSAERELPAYHWQLMFARVLVDEERTYTANVLVYTTSLGAAILSHPAVPPKSEVLSSRRELGDGAISAGADDSRGKLEPSALLMSTFLPKDASPADYLQLQIGSSPFNVHLRAEGGVVHLSHIGSLAFGHVGCKHRYRRKITLRNEGTVPAVCHLYWLVLSGRDKLRPDEQAVAASKREAVVSLGKKWERGAAREFWRKSVSKLRELLRTYKQHRGEERYSHYYMGEFSPDQGLDLAAAVEPEKPAVDEDGNASAAAPRADRAGDAGKVPSGLQQLLAKGKKVGQQFERLVTRASGGRSAASDNLAESFAAKLLGSAHRAKASAGSPDARSSRDMDVSKADMAAFGVAAPKKRAARQTSGVTENQYRLKVEPHDLILRRGGAAVVDVEMNLPPSCEGAFNAILCVDMDLAGAERYDIPLQAVASKVEFLIDDSSPLDFGRLPVGVAATKTRTLINSGSILVRFAVDHSNVGLSVVPQHGAIAPGSSVTLTMTFQPADSDDQTDDIVVQSSCSDPLRLGFFGSGGVPQLNVTGESVNQAGTRVDFGRCMIGQEVVRRLTLSNPGSAVLGVHGVLLQKSPVFFKGEEWPDATAVEIPPGGEMHLDVCFRPAADEVFIGRLRLLTAIGEVVLTLRGSGREALLMFNKHQVHFEDCLIGNLYRQSLSLVNVGDVSFSVQLRFEPKEGDEEGAALCKELAASEEVVVLGAFERREVEVLYVPQQTHDAGVEVALVLDSNYSRHQIPVSATCGFAALEISPLVLDVGVFERGKVASGVFTLRNTGTMPLAFRVKQLHKRHARGRRRAKARQRRVRGRHGRDDGDESEDDENWLRLSRWRGNVLPGSDVEITCSVTSNHGHAGKFSEELCIETDSQQLRYFVTVKGHADSCIVNVRDFSSVDLGVGVVGSTLKQTFTVANSGGVPFQYEMQPRFPLVVTPRRGSVDGHSSQDFEVEWTPMSAAQLSTVVVCWSSLGEIAISIRGRAAFPLFRVLNAVVDFGVCALGCSAERRVTVVNSGLLPLSWSLSRKGAQGGFTVHPSEGDLEPKARQELVVRFKPTRCGPLRSEFMVESAGRYRLVTASGVGGSIKLEMPAVLELGKVLSGNWCSVFFTMKNTGLVDLHLDATSFQMRRKHAAWAAPVQNRRRSVLQKQRFSLIQAKSEADDEVAHAAGSSMRRHSFLMMMPPDASGKGFTTPLPDSMIDAVHEQLHEAMDEEDEEEDEEEQDEEEQDSGPDMEASVLQSPVMRPTRRLSRLMVVAQSTAPVIDQRKLDHVLQQRATASERTAVSNRMLWVDHPFPLDLRAGQSASVELSFCLPRAFAGDFVVTVGMVHVPDVESSLVHTWKVQCEGTCERLLLSERARALMHERTKRGAEEEDVEAWGSRDAPDDETIAAGLEMDTTALDVMEEEVAAIKEEATQLVLNKEPLLAPLLPFALLARVEPGEEWEDPVQEVLKLPEA